MASIDDTVASVSEQNEMIETVGENFDSINNNVTEKSTVVNNIEKSTFTQENYDITEAVARTVRGQVDAITDKVYDKLSRRLADEKRRRGV